MASSSSSSQHQSHSYPGAIAPIQMLQLQQQHVPITSTSGTSSMFFNCTTSTTSKPPAPLATAPVSHEEFSFPTLHTSHAMGTPSHLVAQANWRRARDAAVETYPGKRMQGRVKWYDQNKKYGFIISDENREYFVHRDDLQSRNAVPDPHLFTGEYVEYETIPTMDGRLKAANVSGIQHGPLMCDHGKAPIRVVDNSRR